MARISTRLTPQDSSTLKDTTNRRDPTLTSIVRESLRPVGRDQAKARTLLAKARKSARLAPGKAFQIAIQETRAARQE